jgi:hypothetical protein
MRPGFPQLARYGLAAIALHNLEEALTMPAWLAPRLTQLEAQFGIRPLAEDTARFYPGLVVATLVPAVWIAIASKRLEARQPGSPGASRLPSTYSILLLYGVFFANAIAPHLAGAVLLGSYVPGLATAVALVIPVTIALARRALIDQYASPAGLATTVVIAFMLYIPALAVLLGAWRPMT